jgi:hypothetical protein
MDIKKIRACKFANSLFVARREGVGWSVGTVYVSFASAIN